jgi:hypothetical protein
MARERRTFEEFDKEVGKRKTGIYGFGVDMYTKRSGNRERVFRVQWYERSSKYPTHEDYVKALRKQRSAAANGFYCPAGSEWVEKNKTFDYTPEGLEAALWWAENEASYWWDKFANREIEPAF